jgi:hypothetical protein
MGNAGQGVVLTDQVQGVREASPPDGVTIDPDGTIHFDAGSSTGTMKLNNPNAYNSYVWPTSPGTAGQQLETDASGNLYWADADGIDWTAKGQLLVGTGVGTGNETLLNPGPNGQVLKTASGSASGLEWSPLYVDVVPNLNGAAVLPWGTTAQRPLTPTQGYFRFNVDFSQPGRLEVFDDDGATWRQLAYVEPKPTLPDVTYSSNQTVSGAIYCNDFYVTPGTTLTVQGGLFVFALGFIEILGNILVDGNGPNGARRTFGVFVTGGGAVNGQGAGMGAGNTRFAGQPYAPWISPTGSGGSGGYFANSGPGQNLSPMLVQSGDAGDAGGSIVLRSSENIIVTGILSANGSNAFINNLGQSGSVAGGGGGSGGTIILDANRDITLNGAQLIANGGAGGAGLNQGGAGGGGGGGYIITQARFGVLNIIGATSRTVNGASAGAASGIVSNAVGGGGGSNGGAGGVGQTATVAPLAGATGIISNFGSIYPVPSN